MEAEPLAVAGSVVSIVFLGIAAVICLFIDARAPRGSSLGFDADEDEARGALTVHRRGVQLVCIRVVVANP
jgi:hypothetical protein